MKNFINLIIIITVSISLFSFVSSCKKIHTNRQFKLIISKLKHLKAYNKNDSIVNIAQFFLNKPYKSKTLESNHKEKLIVNLKEFDCTTFVETTLAFYLTLKSKQYTYTQYKKNLQLIRYRNGTIEDYTSRIHYYSEWILRNNNKLIQDKTKEMGGEVLNSKVGFMSVNSEKYNKLKSHAHFIEKIKKQENYINQHTFYYIPKNKISKHYPKIENGNIIVLTTHIKGLNIAHLGFAIKKNNRIHLLHASTKGKIQLEKIDLEEYSKNIKHFNGIMVLEIK